jgi:hypothetical protein
MRLRFALAFIFSLMLLIARWAPAGTERLDNGNRVQVDVILKNPDGVWTARKATVNAFTDGRILVCEEFKNSVVVNCLVITDDGEAVVVPVRLKEEKV